MYYLLYMLSMDEFIFVKYKGWPGSCTVVGGIASLFFGASVTKLGFDLR